MNKRIAQAATVVLALTPTIAHAQEALEEGARRELIAQADEAARVGDHARAVALARRAAGLRATPSLMAFLAREHRSLDQRVEALDQARACLRAAEADASLRNRATILRVCEAVRAEVEPRVGRLEVRVLGDAPAGLAVRLGDRALVPALFGVPMPVMPGAARVVAEAPGYLRFEREVAVAEGSLVPVEVSLTPEAPAAPPALPVVPVVVAPAPPVVAPAPPPRAAPPSMGPGPWIVGGAAVASFALAGVFFGLSLDAQADRDAACPVPEQCPSEAAGALADGFDARYGQWRTGTQVALGVGAAALTGAVIWYAVSRFTSGRAPVVAASWVAPRVGFSF
jgi:hypothetical protein